jgi:phospholipid/cholesterol/gamma-HCH transport system substrate-binding protein
MPRQVVVRGVVVAVLAAAAVLLAVVLLRGGGGYTVDARFINAGNLVNGNLVTVVGEEVGKVEDIRLSDDGQAIARLTISDEYAPLRQGTRAVVRKRSLSSVANDVIELQLGEGDAPALDDGDVIAAIDTESDVPLDELFNAFDKDTRVAVGDTFKLLRDLTQGKERQSRAAYRYLNPALASSSRLFQELDRNKPDLERFITATASLTTDLSARDDDLAGLVTNLGTTMRALATERGSLGSALDRLPTFLRRTNTTFVNLRASLDDLDPLVTAARPVVRDRLRPFFAELRPFAAGAEPTVRDLSRTIRRPGADNDLVEVLQRQPAIDQIANRTAERNGAQREGAFPAMQRAARGATPQLAFFRPYTVDAVGWFDDFSTSGAYDALGSYSRAGLALNQFSITPTLDALVPVPGGLRPLLEGALPGLKTGRNNRCPGSNERRAADGSNPYKPSPDFNCDATQVPIGP